MVSKKMFEIRFSLYFMPKNWVIGFNWIKNPKCPLYVRIHLGPYSTTIKIGDSRQDEPVITKK